MIGNITEIKHFATHDGPGIRTTIFLKGCPLKCKWCANPETQEPHREIFFIARRCSECGECVKICPKQAISMKKDAKIDRLLCDLCMQCTETCKYRALEQVGMEVTLEGIVKKLEMDRPFYNRSNGGVTISGGEPLYQSEFLSELLTICRQMKIHTCIDTCGFADEKSVRQALKHADLVLFDLKHMDSSKHKLWTGAPNDIILKNAKLIARERETRVSLPLVPGVNDDDENIKQTIEFAKSIEITYLDVLPLHRLGHSKYEFLGLQSPFPNFPEVSEENVEKIIKLVKRSSLNAAVGRSM